VISGGFCRGEKLQVKSGDWTVTLDEMMIRQTLCHQGQRRSYREETVRQRPLEGSGDGATQVSARHS
jgi:hypothetical protein